jgi:phosphatidylglycerophosphate synthase
MNLPNKITMVRIFLAVLVLVLLMFPFSSVGIDMPLYTVGTNVIISLNYIIFVAIIRCPVIQL